MIILIQSKRRSKTFKKNAREIADIVFDYLYFVIKSTVECFKMYTLKCLNIYF